MKEAQGNDFYEKSLDSVQMHSLKIENEEKTQALEKLSQEKASLQKDILRLKEELASSNGEVQSKQQQIQDLLDLQEVFQQ